MPYNTNQTFFEVIQKLHTTIKEHHRITEAVHINMIQEFAGWWTQ